MNAGVLHSLQTKLIATFVLVVLAALVLSAVVFVLIRRGEQERQALDRAAAAFPSIQAEFVALQFDAGSEGDLREFVRTAAAEQDVRVVLVDGDGTVVEDTDGELTGQQLAGVPREGRLVERLRGGTVRQGWLTFEPPDGSPGAGLIFIPSGGNVRATVLDLAQRRNLPFAEYSVLLAVSESDIAAAWKKLVPGLISAAAIALPVAVLLAVLLARYITRPLQQLTAASERMAEGRYDVQVSIDRQDEVGRLAQAFSTMAQRVGEAQSQMRALVANVSHDLKTPLTSVLGFSKALRDGQAADEVQARHMGEVIYEEASRLSARLSDLLYLSEAESGQVVLQPAPLDMGELASSTLERLRPALADAGVSVVEHLPRGTFVSADGPKLERAVENLLDNARKFTPRGGEVRLELGRSNGRAVLTVANGPVDVRLEEVERLFERFYRRDRSRSSPADGLQGSGLGLPIARDIARLHGGTLDAALHGRTLRFGLAIPLDSGQELAWDPQERG